MTEQPKQPVEGVLVEPDVEGVLVEPDVEGVLEEQQVVGLLEHLLLEEPDKDLLDSNRFTVRSPNVYVNYDLINGLSPEERRDVLEMLDAYGFFM